MIGTFHKNIIVVLMVLNLCGNSMSIAEGKVKVLLFTKTNGYVHQSRLPAVDSLKLLENNYPFEFTHTEDSLYFRNEILSQYDVIAFLSTSGSILDDEGKAALQNFIRSGKGFVGIHSASATEYEWEWYGQLVGAFFDKHPKIQDAVINVVDSNHISTDFLPKSWKWNDEWYNWRSLPAVGINILLTVEESTYSGGKHGGFHPIAWCHEFDGGRSWYTAIGHSIESYTDENFKKHLAGGIIWAASKEKILTE